MRRREIRGLALLSVLWWVSGCAHAGLSEAESRDLVQAKQQAQRAAEQAEALKEQLDEIARKQDEILRRLRNAPGPAAAEAQPDAPSGPMPVEIGEAAVKGNAHAKVTVVEWSDFECPFCSRVQKTLDALQKRWPDEVRLVFKHNPLPFHAGAVPAAMAAEAAGRQGKFWEMHDRLFAAPNDFSEKALLAHAKALKLDQKRFRADLNDEKIAARVRDDMAQGEALGVKGTPIFFINGQIIEGALPLPMFTRLVEAEMKRAQGLLDSGTPRDELYEALTGAKR